MTRKSPPAELPPYPEAWLRERGYIPRKDGAWGVWQRGTCFSPGQMEWFTPPGPIYEGTGMFGVVELETGEWLDDLHLHSAYLAKMQPILRRPLFPSRAAALEHAVRRIERTLTSQVIGYTGPDGVWHTPVWEVPRGRAERVIDWACAIAGIEPIPIPERPPARPPPSRKPPVRFADAGPLFALPEG